MTRKILLWVALAICEAIMIAAFLLYRGDMPTEVVILDMVVCSIVLGLLFVDIVRPWGDEHTVKLGSMGVRWTVTILYASAAIGVLVAMKEYQFATQLLIQGGLLVLLLLGLAGGLRTREQIVVVHKEENQKLERRDDVRKAWRDLVEKMDNSSDFPTEMRERADRLVQEMRYLAPTNNAEALDTDGQLAECAAAISRMVGDYRMNKEQVEQMLDRAERLLKRRRAQFSK